jgi:hypothetical protein
VTCTDTGLQGADGEVTEGGHDGGAGAGADLGGVLAVGDVAYVVEGFDLPVAADPGSEFVGPGLVGGEAGDGVDGDGRPFAAVAGPGLEGDGDGLGGVREQQPFGRDDPEGAALSPAVSVVVLDVPHPNLPPWQLFELVV